MRTKLVAIRKEMGLSQKKASVELKISRSHYSQIESGDKNPSLDIALRIKQFFNYFDDDIFLNVFAPNRENHEIKSAEISL